MLNHQVNLLFTCHIMTQFIFLVFESFVEEELIEIIRIFAIEHIHRQNLHFHEKTSFQFNEENIVSTRCFKETMFTMVICV